MAKIFDGAVIAVSGTHKGYTQGTFAPDPTSSSLRQQPAAGLILTSL